MQLMTDQVPVSYEEPGFFLLINRIRYMVDLGGQ